MTTTAAREKEQGELKRTTLLRYQDEICDVNFFFAPPSLAVSLPPRSLSLQGAHVCCHALLFPSSVPRAVETEDEEREREKKKVVGSGVLKLVVLGGTPCFFVVP